MAHGRSAEARNSQLDEYVLVDRTVVFNCGKGSRG